MSWRMCGGGIYGGGWRGRLGGQDAGVEMKGAVRDMVGVIPGAKVLLKGVSEFTLETGLDGTYSVEGKYSIEVLKPGYARLMVGARRMDPAKTARAAKLLKKVNPAYPPEAKQARIQGTVRMRAVISKEGEVLGLTLLMSPSAELARSATLLNGQPVEIQTEADGIADGRGSRQ